MPNLFSFASHGAEDTVQEVDNDQSHKQPRRPSLLKNIGSLLKKHHDRHDAEQPFKTTLTRTASVPETPTFQRPVPSLPRPQTVRRQDSERKEKLQEVPQSPGEKRGISVDRRRSRGLSATAVAKRQLSPPCVPTLSISAPDIGSTEHISFNPTSDRPNINTFPPPVRNAPSSLPPLQIPERMGTMLGDDQDEDPETDLNSLQEEYDQRWILNLTMHFRDKSNREKFFVTYAETPGRWRRLTISIDYRNALEGSLEADLSNMHYQRDKSFRIYEAIRESLLEIQYYDTVTNLKLETTAEDCQLHVHVREDANETIHYPSATLFQHVHCPMISETDLEFIGHISGFVYKVRSHGTELIKKEIPGPQTVDEFLYEVNALDALLGCKNVVQLQGLVTDESGSVVKGLLISYAPQGALVDMIYDFRGSAELPWYRREKWAKQIVQGLSDIHEAGFVQGDFTLSNIVIDDDDNAQIIDINRRGCPVGWEPPELSRLIESGQRISMCIGVKTDLYQLGMVLWALAEEVDEPERMERPLPRIIDTAPDYIQRMVETCLSERPQGRVAAKRLLRSFPTHAGRSPSNGRRSVDFATKLEISDNSVSTHRSDKEYIDPNMAVTLDEVRRPRGHGDSEFISDQVTYVDPESNPASTTYRFESSGSWIVGNRRGRSPVSSRRRRSSPFGRTPSSQTSLTESDSPISCPPRAGSRGSDYQVNDKRHNPTSYPPAIAVEDRSILPSGMETDDPQHQNYTYDTPPHERNLDHLPPSLISTKFLHTDSGFDEHMIEELELGDSSQPNNQLPRHVQAVDSAVSTRFAEDKLAPPRAEDELTMDPDSFYTPAASPDPPKA